MNRQLFWCDVCSLTAVDNEGNESKGFYSCYSAQAWIKHIKSAKHTKQIKLNESLTKGQGVVCGECSKTFTKEGYAVHQERNKPLWDCYKTTEIGNMTCNNFCVGKKRYENIIEYKESKHKPKQKRVKVGSFSPVTQSTRPPNTKGGKKKQSVSIVSDDEDTQETEEQDLLEIEQLRKQYYIDKARKQEQLDKDEANEKKKLKNNPSLKRLTESVKSVEIVKGLELTIEEIDYTERPQFDECCDDCSLPVNYDIPINILNKWEIYTCSCEETDYSSDED